MPLYLSIATTYFYLFASHYLLFFALAVFVSLNPTLVAHEALV